MAAVFTIGFLVLVLVCGYLVFRDDDDRNDTWRGY